MKRPSVALAAALILLQFYSSLWALPATAYDAEMVVTGWLKADPRPLGMVLGPSIEKVETFTDNIGEPAYHAVYLQPSGVVIVSADDLIEPIIGFVNSNRYDSSPENPLGALVARDLKNRMAAVRNTFSPLSIPPKAALNKFRQKWSYFTGLARRQNGGFELMGQEPICDVNPSEVRVAPLIRSKWDQQLIYYDAQTSLGPACYNYYTPQILPGGELSWDKGHEYDGDSDNYFSGCIATATAQLMLYYRWPAEAPVQPDFDDPNNTVGVGEKDPNGAFVPLVPRVYRSLLGGDESGGRYKWQDMDFVPDENTTLAQRKAIGAICHDAGVAAKMDYTADGSSTELFNAKAALVANFRYGNAVWGSSGADSLGSGLIGMVLPNLDAKRPVILGISGENSSHSVICDGYGYDVAETLYHHLNMGWSGTDDCWYNLPTIECGVSGYEYDTVFECIYNVFKDGNGEIISGRVLDADNKPARANIVCLEYDGRLIDMVETDANGIFAFVDVNSSATYTVWIQGRDFPTRTVTTGFSEDGFSVSGNRWAVDFPSSRKMLYVNRQAAAGAGDGSSWTDAFIDLQDALEAAANSPGKVGEIWVAAGTYKPDGGTRDRSLSFRLLDGVGLYGGFAGGETYRQQRNPQINVTTLSGDLNGDDEEGLSNMSDNSRHVVSGGGTSESAIIDGFTISGGNADGESSGSLDDIGGGMYISGASPSVRNCIFGRNSARLGGGIFIWEGSPALFDCEFTANLSESGGGIYSYKGQPALNNCMFTMNLADCGGGIYNDSSSPRLENCHFTSNVARLAGNKVGSSAGGIYNYYSDPKLINCVFSANSADYGAGIYNDNSSLELSNCEFTGNIAKLADGEGGSFAGGVYNYYSDSELTNCVFGSNSADYGGGIYNDNCSPTLRNCTFNMNSAAASGGAVNNKAGNPILTSCVFSGNSADWGAGIFNDHSSTVLKDCNFIENTAQTNGGGMHSQNESNAEITGCIFNNNSAQSGGGISNNTSSPVLTNCSFIGNRAILNNAEYNALGGGISNYTSDTVLFNCILCDNSAQYAGAVFNSADSRPTLTNCNLIYNRAGQSFGGIYNMENCRSELTNCIVWGNTGGHIYGSAAVYYSDFQGGWKGEGSNNIDEDPLFADVGNGDYHLKSRAGRWEPVSRSWIADNITSPCIDAGDPGMPVSDEPEPNGGRINIGAYGGTVEASKSP